MQGRRNGLIEQGRKKRCPFQLKIRRYSYIYICIIILLLSLVLTSPLITLCSTRSIPQTKSLRSLSHSTRKTIKNPLHDIRRGNNLVIARSPDILLAIPSNYNRYPLNRKLYLRSPVRTELDFVRVRGSQKKADVDFVSIRKSHYRVIL